MDQEKRVLVLEDYKNFREGLVQLLAILGYIPLAAECLDEAKNHIAAHQVYAAILDNSVPERLGEATKTIGETYACQLRRDHPIMRIALCSAFKPDHVDELLQDYRIKFLEKPVDEDSLIAFLQ